MRRRILLVEDDADSREALSALLVSWGHDVAVADNAPTALELLVTATPDVILADIGLPGMDGYALAETIRARAGVRPILVALTGYGREEDVARARAVGFDLHVLKPANLDDLRDVIAQSPPVSRRPG